MKSGRCIGARTWILRDFIGAGGQGSVCLAYAEDDPKQTPFALKRLRLGARGTADRPREMHRRRFRAEVLALQALGSLGCPQIVSVIDADVGAETGEPWFVTPYYAAGAMWQKKRKPAYVEDYVGNVSRVLEIGGALARTLAFIHETSPGYVHRDVKCGNVFFDEVGGPPTLGDFGLVYSEAREGPETAVGDRMGPGKWRPPELRRGGVAKNHSGSDVYLLGGLIYEALTGGESIDEIEDVGAYFAHERPEFTIARYTTDDRVEHVNRLLRGMFRRDPDTRLRASTVAMLCDAILHWAPGDAVPRPGDEMTEAEEAAAEYRVQSVAVRNEAIRTELDGVCERIANRFGERSWAPINQVTKMVDKNAGDSEPLTHLRSHYPDSVWMALRITVAFETHNVRPMLMSYVFIGRLDADRELVGLYTVETEWEVLADGAPGNPAHEELMATVAANERARLLKKLAQMIRELR